VFAFAGLWDTWKDEEGQLAPVVCHRDERGKRTGIHPRMPVILHSRDYDRWLDREETEQPPLDLLRPFESEAMEMYKANLNVGNVRNSGPEMLRAERAAEARELTL
jgi:putative SOS response-associated peptidase YedK